MSIISKWAVQAVVLFLLGWVATVTSDWSRAIVSGSGNDRLAELNSGAPGSASVLDARDVTTPGTKP